MKRVIFTDLAADLTLEERVKIGLWPDIYVQEITINGEPTEVPMEQADKFYDKLDAGDITPGNIKTAATGTDGFEKIIKDIIATYPDGAEIVYAGISPEMSSGTTLNARIAMNNFSEAYPPSRYQFKIVDTGSISNGLATYLQYLAAYDGDDIEAYAADLREHIVHLFTIKDLSFAAKSGRFSLLERIAMILSSALKMSVWMYFPNDGKLLPDSRPRRGDKILSEWADYYVEHAADDNRFIRIGYGSNAVMPRVEKFIKLLTNRGVSEDMIQLVHVGPIIGAHTGPTVLSFFFKERDSEWRHAKK